MMDLLFHLQQSLSVAHVCILIWQQAAASVKVKNVLVHVMYGIIGVVCIPCDRKFELQCAPQKVVQAKGENESE